MEFRNLTPFPALAFEALDVEDVQRHVVVTRLTYDLVAQGYGEYRMELAEEQPPLIVEDQFYGEPNISSVVQESDLAPFKPKCDVLVIHASAWAPEGRAIGKFYCSVRVGTHEKVLRVTGPRVWEWRLLRWVLLDPLAVTEVPLCYENAYGGDNRYNFPEEAQKPPFWEAYAQNPVGKGWMHPKYPLRDKLKTFAAPQIESLDAPVTRMDGEYTPQGFGAVGRAWKPRIDAAGTYDDAWKQERWPNLPKDFKFSYWNCAHPDLQIPYPTPGTEIELRHLTPEGRLFTRLPLHRAFVLGRFSTGLILPLQSRLDTLILNVRDKQVHLVYRTRVPEVMQVRVLEARFEMDPQQALLTLQPHENSSMGGGL